MYVYIDVPLVIHERTDSCWTAIKIKQGGTKTTPTSLELVPGFQQPTNPAEATARGALLSTHTDQPLPTRPLCSTNCFRYPNNNGLHVCSYRIMSFRSIAFSEN